MNLVHTYSYLLDQLFLIFTERFGCSFRFGHFFLFFLSLSLQHAVFRLFLFILLLFTLDSIFSFNRSRFTLLDGLCCCFPSSITISFYFSAFSNVLCLTSMCTSYKLFSFSFILFLQFCFCCGCSVCRVAVQPKKIKKIKTYFFSSYANT